MFEIDKVDNYSVFEIMDDESKLETTLYVEGDKNDLLENETTIKSKNVTIVYEKDSLFVDLRQEHRKSYKSDSDSIAGRIYSVLSSIKDLIHSVDAFANEDYIYVNRFIKGSGRSVQQFAFHPNDLLEVSYNNLSGGKVFFLFKFTDNRAVFMNRERLEFIKGNNRMHKFGDFRFLDNPLRKVL